MVSNVRSGRVKEQVGLCVELSVKLKSRKFDICHLTFLICHLLKETQASTCVLTVITQKGANKVWRITLEHLKVRKGACSSYFH